MRRRLVACVLAAGLAAACVPGALAQDGSNAPASTDSSSAPAAAPAEGPIYSLPPAGNPLEGLFTPQPQYPTPQSVHNPEPFIPQGNEENPIKALFNVQPQYPTPQNPGYPTPDAPKSDNHLQGLFTGQPRFATPQTPVNPQPQPKYLIPGFNSERGPWKPGQPTDGGAAERAELAKKKEAEAAAAKAKDGGGKDAKDGKGKDAKEKDAKDKTSDKDKAAADKTAGDKAAADKDKNAGSAPDKDAAGKDQGADKSSDKDKTGDNPSGDDADEDATAKSDKDKEKQPPVVYNPLKEAIFLMNSGQPQQALTRLSQTLQTHPWMVEAHYLRAVALVSMRKFNDAAQEYRTVIKMVPSSSLATLAAEGLRKIGGTLPESPKLPPLNR